MEMAMAMADLRFWCCLFAFAVVASCLAPAPPQPAQVPAPLHQESHPLSLRLLWDGTVAAHDKDTDEIRWSFSSGPPLTSSHGLLLENAEDPNDTTVITGEPDIPDDKYVFCGTDWKLYSYDKHSGTEGLPISPDVLVKSTPAVLDGAVILGSLATSAFLVYADSGILVSRFDSRYTFDTAGYDEQENTARLMETTFQKSKDDNYLYILRKDYTLSSVATGSGALLWNVSLGKVELLYGKPDDFPRLPHLDHAARVGSLPIPRLDYSNPRKSLVEAVQYPIPTVTNPGSVALIPSEGHSHGKRNTRAEFSVKRALPSGEERGNQSVPPSAHEIYHSFLDRGFFKAGFVLLSTIFLAFGCWRAVVLYSRFVLKQNKKEKQSQSGKRRRGRKHKDMITEPAAADKAPPHASTHGHRDDHLSTKTAIKFTSESSSEGNDTLIHWNTVKDKFDRGEGSIVGSLFVTKTIIGYGSHGTIVFKGYLDKRDVAVKRLLGQFHEKAEKEIANLIVSDEHPNVVRYYSMEVDAHFVYVALERCSFNLNDLIVVQSLKAQNNSAAAIDRETILKVGDAKDHVLWDGCNRPSPKLLQFMRDILAGLSHLHNLGIVHRDLKPQNVLISSGHTLRAKLSDMGISKRLVDDATALDPATTGLGSSGWQAPEQLRHQKQTRSVDLFSLGCILFFCTSGGHHPFGDPIERDRNIVNGKPDFFPVEHVPEAVDLFSSLLDIDPMKRPPVKDVIVHPLFWGCEKRLSFLRDASDRVELEDRECQSPLLEDIEAASSVALGCSWDEKLEIAFLESLRRYRRYNYGSVRDLLRVIRNKSNHYRELPQDVQQLVGSYPEGYDNYFRNKFPRLLLEVFKVVHKHCRHEHLFQTYFSLDA